LYDPAAYPEHILPMRKEAEGEVAAEGWTKKTLDSMHKIDSFLRESQRLSGAVPLAMGRQVIAKDRFRFSDGRTLPYGSFLSVPGIALQSDPGTKQFSGRNFIPS
ncbi:hypothetical protein B0H19DRAFT_964266, partial [Mycena capillaripes]